MDVLNIETARSQLFRAGRGNIAGIVGRIIEYLDLEQLARIIELADRAQKAFDHVNFVKNRELNGHFRQLLKVAGRHGRALTVFQEEIDDEIPMNAIGRQAHKHGEVTRRPNHIAETSLHKVGCQLLRQQVRMMALPSPASNQKWHACLDKTGFKRVKIRAMSILFATSVAMIKPTEKIHPIRHK